MESSGGELGVFTPDAGARSSTVSLLLGQVMFLVAVALAFFALGTYIGRDLSYTTGLVCELGAIAMLFAQAFVGPLRTGTLAVGWLYALALLLGIGLGPVINYYTTYDQTVLYQAAGGTALTVAGMGAFGFATSRDLVRWARPLFWAFLAVILASWILVLFTRAATSCSAWRSTCSRRRSWRSISNICAAMPGRMTRCGSPPGYSSTS